MAVRKGNRKEIFRLLDANLNRSREGLRVLEDTARFLRNDGPLYRRIRRERHLLDKLTRRFYPDLVSARNSRKDEGRSIPEPGRKDVRSIVFANLRRCEESLRVLEEYGKIFPGGAAEAFKAMRFRMYDLEKKFVEAVVKRGLFRSSFRRKPESSSDDTKNPGYRLSPV